MILGPSKRSYMVHSNGHLFEVKMYTASMSFTEKVVTRKISVFKTKIVTLARNGAI